MRQSFFLKHAKKLAKKYAGQYIAVANNKIIAVSKSRLSAYKKALKKLPSKQTLGIYYLPKPEELLSALWISLI